MEIHLDNYLPEYPSFVSGIRRAPDRGYSLTPAQTETALMNALRYIPVELHEKLAPEFMEELLTRGRIYGYRYRPQGDLKAVVTYVRNHLSEKTGKDYSNLPFIFGTVAKKNKQYGSEVEAAMKRFAKEDKNAYLIDMSDAELMGDRLHFNQNSAEYLGKQMYEQIKAIR